VEITRVAVDAMGGDNAPVEIVKGAINAVNGRKDIEVILVGDENIIKQCDITLSWLKRKIPCYWLLMVYPLVFMPFRDVFISDVTTNIMNFLIEILREIGLWS